jgi:hypothetical protein
MKSKFAKKHRTNVRYEIGVTYDHETQPEKSVAVMTVAELPLNDDSDQVVFSDDVNHHYDVYSQFMGSQTRICEITTAKTLGRFVVVYNFEIAGIASRFEIMSETPFECTHQLYSMLSAGCVVYAR